MISGKTDLLIKCGTRLPLKLKMRNNQKLDQIEIMNGEYQSSNTHNSQSRPNICRNARPIPTSILFRDVEAQAVAANVALRKAAGNKFENASKGPSKKKKTIKINQIGAPTLLSASADLNTIRLQSASHNKKESINRELHFSLHLQYGVSHSLGTD
ncbi:hypothetical protein BY996DRAFT_51479 [Phakopsora pachyrhizi]|nr:hypothetical protein BY996DRAFT_51479 [Phakopsora pachyrhizi]